MGDIKRNKLYYTVCKLLQQVNDNEEIEETTGHKEVHAYIIDTESTLALVKSITIANYKNSEEELAEALEEEYGKRYGAYEFIFI